AAVKLWREYAPNSDEANQYYLGLVVLSDNLVEAEKLLKQRLAEATPGGRGLVMFQMQQLLLRAKDKEAAAAMLERLVAPYPNMMESHVVLAQADNPPALYALGILWMQMNDQKAAEQYFSRFVDLAEKTPSEDNDPSKAILILSQMAEEHGDIKGALAWLDRLETDDPKMAFG